MSDLWSGPYYDKNQYHIEEEEKEEDDDMMMMMKRIIITIITINHQSSPYFTPHDWAMHTTIGNGELIINHLLEGTIRMHYRMEWKEFIGWKTAITFRDTTEIGLILL